MLGVAIGHPSVTSADSVPPPETTPRGFPMLEKGQEVRRLAVGWALSSDRQKGGVARSEDRSPRRPGSAVLDGSAERAYDLVA